MVRPLKSDRENIAITTMRVSAKTKRLLQDLKQKHGFATIDQVLRYYLPSDLADNRPVLLTARQTYDLMHWRPIDKLIKEASREIMKQSKRVG
jgi:hypothetical protein